MQAEVLFGLGALALGAVMLGAYLFEKGRRRSRDALTDAATRRVYEEESES